METDITVDGGGHVLRTNTPLLCRGMRKRFPFVVTWLARPKILDGPKHDFLPMNGTNDHEQPRSVPSGSTRSNRAKTRLDTCYEGGTIVPRTSIWIKFDPCYDTGSVPCTSSGPTLTLATIRVLYPVPLFGQIISD